jgi:nucleoside-binding protein
MKDGIREAASLHPDKVFIHVSGDDVLTGKARPTWATCSAAWNTPR